MHQHFWDGALPYFSNKQWNFGRFLNHLATLPNFPADQKSRRELGTELWVSLLAEFAENDSQQENKFKAVQELAKIKKPSKTVTNNASTINGFVSTLLAEIAENDSQQEDKFKTVAKIKKPSKTVTNNVVNASTINGLVNCTIDTANSNIFTPPSLGAKQVEVCHVLQPGNSEPPILRNAISPVPPPPYDVPVTAGGSDKLPRQPTITPSSYAAHPTNESPEAARHSPAHHPYRGRYPSTNKAGELGGIDLSGYDFEFPESLGDETMDLIAAVDLGTMDVGFNANFNRRLHANKLTESNMDEDVGVEVDVRSNASSNNQPLFLDEPNKPSSDRVADKFFSRGSSPIGRLPSFSRFDAIPSDCAGCCLHPPTSQCRSRTASPASSPPETGIPRIQSPGAHASPTRVQTPSGLNTPKDREEVNSRPASFTALNEISTPSQDLKHPITADKTHSTYRKLLEIQSHNLNMQSHNLKMQMALNEILMDELDTWASPKRRKL